MANTEMITKRVAISKANAQMVGVVAAASFVTIFCLVAAHAVWGQNSYQARVTTAKDKAHQQLLKNIAAYDTLTRSYQAFVSTPTNVISGNSSGTGDNDGDNAKIILDALPPSYDFPALTSSIEKILTDRGFSITNISGTDDQLNQQNNSFSPNPQPVSMPFMFTVSNANYTSIGQLITTLQESIRPIQIDSIDLSGGQNSMTATINAHTYYQPGKSVNITKKAVK
jgi:hypothetical protein